MSFYWNIWQQYGVLHNAQAIGVNGVFHIHENDDVEITGYLIVQAFDYLKMTGDEEFIMQLLPMLEWAWNSQKKHLAGYMIPFNGDETYVAGGVLPRNTLNDGSAEATMLFVCAGESLLRWIGEKNAWDSAKLAQNLEVLEQTKTHFPLNFMKEGELVTNNPERKCGLELNL